MRSSRSATLESEPATGRSKTSEGENAMNETSITIVGNVISDLKARRTAEGHRVVSFRVASNERRFDKETGDWVDGDRLFVSVTCWRRLANGVAMSLSKGDPVMVTGRLYTRGYEVEGQKRSVTEVLATAVGPDLSRCAAELMRVRRSAGEDVAVTVASEPTTGVGEENSEVPGQPSDVEHERERPRLEVVGATNG
jgi:single-strand DNA-binding protein